MPQPSRWGSVRPGAAVTLALLRRVAWTAAGASGLDLLGRAAVDGALAQLQWVVPGVKELAAGRPARCRGHRVPPAPAG